MFKISSNNQKKHANFSNGELFQKSLVPLFFQLAWNWNFKEKAFSDVKTKTCSNFAINLDEMLK